MNTQDFRIGAGSLSIDGVDIGATTPNGIVVNYEPEIHLHKSGKYGNTPVKASIIGKTLTLEVEVAETTLKNMEAVFADVTSTGTQPTKIAFGNTAGREIAGKSLIMTPFDGAPAWTFRKAIPTGAIEVAYKVEDERVYKVVFTALVDSAAPEASNLAFVS